MNNGKRSDDIDDDEHDKMPDPPDLENYSFTKLGMKNLNDYIDNKLVKQNTEKDAKNIEEMLVNVNQVPS
jgi:hypothetical protein